MTLEAAARKIRVQPRYLSEMERGVKPFPFRVASLLAQSYGGSLNDFLPKGDGSPRKRAGRSGNLPARLRAG